MPPTQNKPAARKQPARGRPADATPVTDGPPPPPPPEDAAPEADQQQQNVPQQNDQKAAAVPGDAGGGEGLDGGSAEPEKALPPPETDAEGAGAPDQHKVKKQKTSLLLSGHGLVLDDEEEGEDGSSTPSPPRRDSNEGSEAGSEFTVRGVGGVGASSTGAMTTWTQLSRIASPSDDEDEAGMDGKGNEHPEFIRFLVKSPISGEELDLLKLGRGNGTGKASLGSVMNNMLQRRNEILEEQKKLKKEGLHKLVKKSTCHANMTGANKVVLDLVTNIWNLLGSNTELDLAVRDAPLPIYSFTSLDDGAVKIPVLKETAEGVAQTDEFVTIGWLQTDGKTVVDNHNCVIGERRDDGSVVPVAILSNRLPEGSARNLLVQAIECAYNQFVDVPAQLQAIDEIIELVKEAQKICDKEKKREQEMERRKAEDKRRQEWDSGVKDREIEKAIDEQHEKKRKSDAVTYSGVARNRKEAWSGKSIAHGQWRA